MARSFATMARTPSTTSALTALIVLFCVSTTQAQGVLNRAGESLDNAGRNIRDGVEKAVARGQANAQEHELRDRVIARFHSDKRFRSAKIHVRVEGGSVILSGVVGDDTLKTGAVQLAENAYGAENVVDDLVVGKELRVGERGKDTQAIEPKKVVRSPEMRRTARSSRNQTEPTITIEK